MIYLVDNYDSFTYNLYQLVGVLSTQPVKVIKNDEMSAEELSKANPSAFLFSPGPGNPNEAGNTLSIMQYFLRKVPILGICLGHQAIGQSYGAQIVHAPQLMHGKADKIKREGPSELLQQCPPTFTAARYHSLVIDPQTVPSSLHVTAKAADGTIQAIEDPQKQVYGVQFHPESIMTDKSVGQQIIKNFLAKIGG